MLTSTTFEVPGARTVRCLGLVRGITVRTRSLPVTILGSVRMLFGGRAGIFTDLCETARDESFRLMVAHAQELDQRPPEQEAVDQRGEKGAPRPKSDVAEDVEDREPLFELTEKVEHA